MFLPVDDPRRSLPDGDVPTNQLQMFWAMQASVRAWRETDLPVQDPGVCGGYVRLLEQRASDNSTFRNHQGSRRQVGLVSLHATPPATRHDSMPDAMEVMAFAP